LRQTRIARCPGLQSFHREAAHEPYDLFPRSDFFLAYKAHDSKVGACLYYKAIGAVRACDATGAIVEHIPEVAFATMPLRTGDARFKVA
jgi:hypothetical protein